jgi:hypothetical protein
MFMAKQFSGHCSFINQIELHKNNLFTTGINDECIIKWKLTEDKVWQDLDNLDYNTEENDVVAEFISKEKFMDYKNKILPMRNEIY